ncbi:MAG: polysaccharide pyruvyl transferase family protein [Candidatus Bathyarchaeia archaeon]
MEGKTVLLGGYYGFGNLGDELILRKLVEDLSGLFGRKNIVVVSGDPENTIKTYGVQAISRFSVESVYEATKFSDFVVVGGGGLIHECFGLDPRDIFRSFGYNVPFYAVLPLFARMLGKPVFYWAHGVGPIFTNEGRQFAKWFYSLCDVCTVRDRYSFQYLSSLLPDLNPYLDTDPVMAFDFDTIPQVLETPFSENRLKIGINLRPWFGIRKTIDEICKAILELGEKDLAIIPIPFDLKLDSEVLCILKERLPGDIVFDPHMGNPVTLEKTISAMRSCDLLLAMRFHAIMAGMKLGIPTVALSYDVKTDQLASEEGLPSLKVEEARKDCISKLFKELLSGSNKERKTRRIMKNYMTPEIFKKWVETMELRKKEPVPEIRDEYYTERFIKMLMSELDELRQTLSRKEKEISEIRKKLSEKEEEILKLTLEFKRNLSEERDKAEPMSNELERLKIEKERYVEELNRIYTSRFWKLASAYYALRYRILVPRLKRLLSLKLFGSTDRDSQKTKNKHVSVSLKEPTFMRSQVSRYDVICLPIIDWSFRFQRPQQICTQFAKGGSLVFYVRPEFLKEDGPAFMMEKVRENIYSVSIRSKNRLNVYTDSMDDSDVEAMLSSIDSLRRKVGIVDAILLCQLPFWYPLAKKMKDEFGWKIIYDCMDEHSGFSTNSVKMLSLEKQLIAESDAVIVSSHKLHAKMGQAKPKCFLIPNATDFEHFSVLPENNLLAHLRRPIVGYYGAISEWFDSELVEFLASRRRDWTFVLIGDTFGAELGNLKNMENVHFLGEKPYEDLPKYLYWFDVCMIPFKVNTLTEATNPVKVYEMMSSGKKVVAVDLPELRGFSDLIYIARSKEEFLAKVEQALEEDDEQARRKRVEFASKNTWQQRYNAFVSAIREAHPKASIIVVTYNNLDYTKICLESLVRKTFYPNFEVIVVDNCSQDGTREYVKSMGESMGFKVVLNESNKGFPAAANQGIRSSCGEYLAILNNDVVVSRGWLSRLIRYLERDESIGLVGPVTNFCGNEARIKVPYVDIEGMEVFSEEYVRTHMDPSWFETNMLAFYCVVLRRRIIEEVGFLDEGYEIGLFEDDDFCHRVRLRGYKIVCAEDVFVHHFGEASFKKLDRSRYLEIFERNKRRFEEKWGLKWRPHRWREKAVD